MDLNQGRTYVFYRTEWNDGTASLVNVNQSTYLKNDDGTLVPTSNRNSIATEEPVSRGIGRPASH